MDVQRWQKDERIPAMLSVRIAPHPVAPYATLHIAETVAPIRGRRRNSNRYRYRIRIGRSAAPCKIHG